MARYAVVESATGIVANVADWDGVSDWSPGAGYEAIEATPGAVIGSTYAAGVFTPPPDLEPGDAA